MRGFDCYVLSSVIEGMPNALLEAMALGRPVVTTSAGDPSQLTARLKDAGITVFHVVPTVRGAEKDETRTFEFTPPADATVVDASGAPISMIFPLQAAVLRAATR